MKPGQGKMDKWGFDKKQDPRTRQKILAMMCMIERDYDAGATIPEIIWTYHSTLMVALDNVRANRLRRDKPKSLMRRLRKGPP
jgi:hypothetical protein